MPKGESITPSCWGLTPVRIITGNALIEAEKAVNVIF